MGLAITTDEVKHYLKIDTNDDDTYVAGLIPLAQEYCEDYMRSSIPDDTPQSIKQAALMLIGFFYENRNGEESGVPEVVHRLLAPYRETIW